MHQSRVIKRNIIRHVNVYRKTPVSKNVKFYELMDLHEDSSNIFLAFITCFLCLIPIPGTGTIFGWFLILLSFCFLFSYSVKTPKIINNFKLKDNVGEKTLISLFYVWNFISKYSKTRMAFLFYSKIRFIWFVVWFIMSILILLPIPFGNTPPAFTLMVFCISWIIKDGLLLLTVPFLSLVSFIPVYLSFEIITSIFYKIQAWF